MMEACLLSDWAKRASPRLTCSDTIDCNCSLMLAACSKLPVREWAAEISLIQFKYPELPLPSIFS